MFINVLILLSILSATVFLLPKRHKVWSAFGVIGAGALVAIGEAVVVLVGKWDKLETESSSLVFGAEFAQTDSLSAIFLIIVSLCALGVVIYSKGYIDQYGNNKSSMQVSIHYFSMCLLFISLLLVVTQQGAYGFLFAWELMSISSFMLMLFNAERVEVRKAALGYLVMMHIAFVLLLVGFILLSKAGLPATFGSLTAYSQTHNPITIFILFLIGFGVKAGVFPLHIWLPTSYSNSPNHVAAFMSGAVSKMGVYGVIRVVSLIDSQLLTIGSILLVVGIVTGLWGVILATLQSDMKRLLAYSSIENIGIIFLAIGAATIGMATNNTMLALCGMGGALLHAVNHSLMKTLLFFGSGNVVSQTGSSSIESLGGVARRMPITATLFLVGVMSICAMPAMGGFVSEFLIYYGLLDTVAFNASSIVTAICSIVALALIGGIVVLAFTKLYGVVFLGNARTNIVERAEEVDKYRLFACAIPVAGILMIGLAPVLFGELVFSIASDLLSVTDGSIYFAMIDQDLIKISITIGVLLTAIVGLYLYKKHKLKSRTIDKSPTWACGFTATNSRMQYGGESFAEGLHNITPQLTNNSGESNAIDKDEFFPSSHSFNTRHKDKVDLLFEAWWVALLHKINVRVMTLRTGKVNYQVLYALLFLLLILILSLFNII